MVELLDYEDENYFQAYLSYQPKIVFLKSKGFEDEFVFYKILAKETIAVKVPINDSMIRVKSFYSQMDGAVVFAFDGEKIYNLTGLSHTDFENFFYAVKSVVGKKHDINVNRKNFSSIFSIEDVDLKCLASQIRKRRSLPCYRILEKERITMWEQDPRLGRHRYVAPSDQK